MANGFTSIPGVVITLWHSGKHRGWNKSKQEADHELCQPGSLKITFIHRTTRGPSLDAESVKGSLSWSHSVAEPRIPTTDSWDPSSKSTADPVTLGLINKVKMRAPWAKFYGQPLPSRGSVEGLHIQNRKQGWQLLPAPWGPEDSSKACWEKHTM